MAGYRLQAVHESEVFVGRVCKTAEALAFPLSSVQSKAIVLNRLVFVWHALSGSGGRDELDLRSRTFLQPFAMLRACYTRRQKTGRNFRFLALAGGSGASRECVPNQALGNEGLQVYIVCMRPENQTLERRALRNPATTECF